MEEGGDAAATPDPSLIIVLVKFSGRTLPLSVSPDSTVRDLKSLLQPLTNALPRGQKLIFKGKVLIDTQILRSLQLTDGSKVMLIASHGLHQGDGLITKDTTSTSHELRSLGANQNQVYKTKTTIEKSRADRWRLTGVVALSDCHLKVVPEEVWDCGPSVSLLDISTNYIQEVSAKIGSFKSLSKLLLNANDISDEGISWKSLSSLKSLAVLSLSQNQLTALPSAVGTLTSLSQLHIANNKLTSLPNEIGFLNQLQILKASNNRISSVPSSIGNCYSLLEIDLSSNLLVELPETFGSLKNLKALHVEGWEDFDERRRSKHQKQLDFRVGSSGVFDEGADDDKRP